VSKENVEMVRAGYEHPDGMGAAFGDRVAVDAEFDFSSIYPDQPVINGLENLQRFRAEGPWAQLKFEPERFIDVDEERVLVLVRAMATGEESGVRVATKAAHEFTFRDGLLVRVKVYGDRDQALQATGLSGDF
jgi:hypothetical protein